MPVETTYQSGSLVFLDGRDWIILPSKDDDLLLLKPLGGSDDQVTGVYLPLGFDDEKPTPTAFDPPTDRDIGSFGSARLLYNAIRLAIRDAAGPFRALGRLSFRPRSYQMVPLIMALRQLMAGQDLNPIRLLIADDVGIGKTIEALLVVKELLERREVERFAVVAPPHLCDQWHAELKEKFGIEAVVIRNSTQAKLDKYVQGDEGIFRYYKYQVVSVDYIKQPKRRAQFINDAPELVVVDEAHTCGKPSGASKNQQLRHALVSGISDKNEHLLLLTATPHSGKPEEFLSLLSLLRADLGSVDLGQANESQRRQVARYMVQRRRGDIQEWHRKKSTERTPFPTREAKEQPVNFSEAYIDLFEQTRNLARSFINAEVTHRGRRLVQYWTALSLLRGVMSSPYAGIQMIDNRLNRLSGSSEIENVDDVQEDFDIVADSGERRLFDRVEHSMDDQDQSDLMGRVDVTSQQRSSLRVLREKLQELSGKERDTKLAALIDLLQDWTEDGYDTVVFCRFIATAKYVHEYITPVLERKFKKTISVQLVTSEDPDEIRKERISAMENSARRVLVATDCISEGVNLQEFFTAVVHYDLPWNPNRLEQREGRVDRFGQTAKHVRAYLLYGQNNPVDGTVLKVLLRKIREIRKSIGISVPFPEDSEQLVEAIAQGVLFGEHSATVGSASQPQLALFEDHELASAEQNATDEIEQAAQREQRTRSIFAQEAIHPQAIEEDLDAADRAIGDPEAVESFVVESLRMVYGAQVDEVRGDYRLRTANVPEFILRNLRGTEDSSQTVPITFRSPPAKGRIYLGRNHPFVEELSLSVSGMALDGVNPEAVSAVRRAAVVRSTGVSLKTVILLFRVRNVIQERNRNVQLVAEEVLVTGYRGELGKEDYLDQDEAHQLLVTVQATGDLPQSMRETILEQEIDEIGKRGSDFDTMAETRAEILVEQHERFRAAVQSRRPTQRKYEVVRPVLPMDLIGVFIVLPQGSEKI